VYAHALTTNLNVNAIAQVVLEVFVSVLAQGSTGDTFRVLVQGALLSSANVHSLLATLKKQLKHLEIDIAHIYLNAYLSCSLLLCCPSPTLP
jgi:hypothetical protein